MIKQLKNILLSYIPDEYYLKYQFFKHFGKSCDLKRPLSFNEKLQWLKLNNRKKEYITLVDKYKVRDYIATTIGKKYLVPLYGVWDSTSEINYALLPNQFVLKTTHDSGGVIICKDKSSFDIDSANKFLTRHLKERVFNRTREWPYKDVKPRIICEALLSDNNNDSIKDYKFFCFNGVPRFLKVDFNRYTHHQANYYSPKWELLPFGEEICPPDFKHIEPEPDNLSEMLVLAAQLSSGIPFLRVDFYNIDGKIYFGELTFFPYSGFGKFVPKSYDTTIGQMLVLPING